MGGSYEKRIKCIICVVLSLVLAWSLVPLTQAEAAKSKLDPEVRRAVTLGIVSSSYLKKPTRFWRYIMSPDIFPKTIFRGQIRI